MFERLVPNLRAIGLLTPRVMERYQRMGFGEFVHMPASDKLSEADLLGNPSPA